MPSREVWPSSRPPLHTQHAHTKFGHHPLLACCGLLLLCVGFAGCSVIMFPPPRVAPAVVVSAAPSTRGGGAMLYEQPNGCFARERSLVTERPAACPVRFFLGVASCRVSPLWGVDITVLQAPALFLIVMKSPAMKIRASRAPDKEPWGNQGIRQATLLTVRPAAASGRLACSSLAGQTGNPLEACSCSSLFSRAVVHITCYLYL